MAVDTPGEFYEQNADKWRMCRDFIAGAAEVRDAGEAYVPRPDGLTQAEYDAYLKRGAFFNGTNRSIDSLVGLVMMKPPEVQIPSSLEQVEQDFDGKGAETEDFVRLALTDVLSVGGGCAVVDVADDQVPYAAWYPIESILEWRLGNVGGRLVLVWLKLAETYQNDKDEWTQEELPQVRVIDLHEGGARVRVYRENGNGWALHEETYLSRRGGERLLEIPAVLFGPTKGEPGKPPILDLVEVNRSHWQNSVDLEHGLHFTGLPTPYVSGHDFADGEKVKLGSSTLIAFPTVGAKLEFGTFGAEGLAAIENAMKRKEAHMAALGARMLVAEGGQAESGEALAIRRSGENSALAKVAGSVSRSMEQVLDLMLMWLGVKDECSFRLNTDYLPTTMTAQDLTAAIAAVDRGLMSQQEFFDMLKAGGLVRDDKTFEEHEEETLGMADRPVDGDEDE